MNETQKVLNWINNNSDLSDYTLMTVTILDENVQERRFRLPELRQIAFNPDIDGERRTMLGKGVGGLIKKWSKDSAIVKPLPFSIMAFRTHEEIPHNKIFEIAEWDKSTDWNWLAKSYWVIGASDRWDDNLQFVAVIPRHKTFNSPAVSWFQKLEYAPLGELIIDESLDLLNIKVLNEFLEEIVASPVVGDTTFHLARIDFRPLSN